MRNNQKKQWLLVLSYVIIVGSITGCNVQDKSDIASDEAYNNKKQEQVVMSDKVIADDTMMNGSNDKAVVDEKEEFDYFETEKQEIKRLIDEEKWEEAKAKAKDVFITGVDFVFYNQEIKGVTWDELKAEGKQLTLDNLEIIDGWIMEVIPNYKESISDKYTKFSKFISSKYYNAVSYIKSQMSDETLDKIEDTKETASDKASEAWDTTKDAVNKGKARVKSWYDGFKRGN